MSLNTVGGFKSEGESDQSLRSYTSTDVALDHTSITSTDVRIFYDIPRIDINTKFCRTRRYDSTYRIGPAFATGAKLASIDTRKPGKLKIYENKYGSELLTYLRAFTEQPDKREIDLHFVRCMLDNGADINERDELGQTVLHAIVRDWHSDVVLFAIMHYADVNTQDRYGRSPLHLAAALDYTDTAKVLLKYNADPNLETYQELQTPLHYAAKYNSIGVLKQLLAHNGSLISRDHKNRSILFLAAEKGCEKTSDYLVSIGVPVGNYDVHGNSALTHLVEKLPSVGIQALTQYFERTNKRNQYELYLRCLEPGTPNSLAKTPLDIITSYNDIDLIMHPVIQASVAMKWKMFGQRDTIRKFVITLLYIGCWMATSLLSDKFFKLNRDHENNWRDHVWSMIFELPIICFALYFFTKDFIFMKKAITNHQEWMEWHRTLIRSQYVFCHPAWPIERESVKNEEEKIKLVPSLATRQRFWLAYECLNLVILSANITTRILAIVFHDNRTIFLVHYIIFAVNMGCGFIRLIKISVRFRYCAVFLKVSSSAFTSFIQIVFLYLQFYIPFVAGFWLWFAATPTLSDKRSHKDRTNDATNEAHPGWVLGNFFYHVYTISFEQEDLLRFTLMDLLASHSLVALFHVFTTFIALSITIAFITAKFKKNIKRCIAEASLLQSSIVLQLERNLSKKDKTKLSDHYENNCNPLWLTDQQMPAEVHNRNPLAKLENLEYGVKRTMHKLRMVEEKYKESVSKNDIVTEKVMYNSVIGACRELNKVQENREKKVTKEFRFLTRKYEYLPILLPKLLPASSDE